MAASVLVVPDRNAYVRRSATGNPFCTRSCWTSTVASPSLTTSTFATSVPLSSVSRRFIRRGGAGTGTDHRARLDAERFDLHRRRSRPPPHCWSPEEFASLVAASARRWRHDVAARDLFLGRGLRPGVPGNEFGLALERPSRFPRSNSPLTGSFVDEFRTDLVLCCSYAGSGSGWGDSSQPSTAICLRAADARAVATRPARTCGQASGRRPHPNHSTGGGLWGRRPHGAGPSKSRELARRHLESARRHFESARRHLESARRHFESTHDAISQSPAFRSPMSPQARYPSSATVCEDPAEAGRGTLLVY